MKVFVNDEVKAEDTNREVTSMFEPLTQDFLKINECYITIGEILRIR